MCRALLCLVLVGCAHTNHVTREDLCEFAVASCRKQCADTGDCIDGECAIAHDRCGDDPATFN